MGGSDLDSWIASIRNCELLPERDLKHLCEYVQEILLEESTVQPVQSPVTICGDIHGQFHDLLELFRNGGECPHTSYIFMVRSLPALAARPVTHHTQRWGACRQQESPLLPPGAAPPVGRVRSIGFAGSAALVATVAIGAAGPPQPPPARPRCRPPPVRRATLSTVATIASRR